MTLIHGVTRSAAACVLSAVFCTGGLAQAPATAPPAQTASGGGQNEGIKVHGHWTIEIRNPDGTLASHNEFENRLTRSGSAMLASILSRHFAVGSWWVQLGAGDQTNYVPPGTSGFYPCADSGVWAGCFVVEPGFQGSHGTTHVGTGPNIFKNLTIDQPGPDSVDVKGFAIADHDATIPYVGTWIATCAAVASNACDATQFTSTDVSPAINVLAGQFIQVTVHVSFS